jgi:hypothetical protein
MYFALILAAIYISSIFVVPLSASAYSAGPQAATAPKIILRPFNSAPGKTVKVTGLRFTPSSTVSITFNSVKVVSSYATNSTGGFVTTFVVPTGTAPGSYQVVATDAKGLTASNTLSISLKTKIVLSTSGKARIVGTTVTVTGTNFGDSEAVTVTFDGSQVATATSSSTGSFTTTFVIPAVPAGTYPVVASDTTTSATKGFTVNPHVTSSASSVTRGQTITVTGTGFAATSTVSFTLGGTPLSTTTTTDSTGSFSVQITIPINQAKGGQALTATDQSSDTASVRLKVLS